MTDESAAAPDCDRTARRPPLRGAALLAAWERGAAAAPPLRGVALLAAGPLGMEERAAATLPLPARDAALLALHRSSFGETLQGFGTCGACGERLEFALPAGALAGRLEEAPPGGTETVVRGAWTITCRLAAEADLAAVAAAPDTEAGRALLLARCVAAAGPDGPAPLDALPEEVRTLAEARLAVMHDAAELSLSIRCPGCGAGEDVVLDLADFLWAETRHAAHRLLREVHELAWAYGWSEEAILGMGAARRAAYLALVRG